MHGSPLLHSPTCPSTHPPTPPPPCTPLPTASPSNYFCLQVVLASVTQPKSEYFDEKQGELAAAELAAELEGARPATPSARLPTCPHSLVAHSTHPPLTHPLRPYRRRPALFRAATTD